MTIDAKRALRSGIAGGLAGGLISGTLNYGLLPFPRTLVDNAVGHGMSGFFSGLAAAVVATLLAARHHRVVKPGQRTP